MNKQPIKSQPIIQRRYKRENTKLLSYLLAFIIASVFAGYGYYVFQNNITQLVKYVIFLQIFVAFKRTDFYILRCENALKELSKDRLDLQLNLASFHIDDKKFTNMTANNENFLMLLNQLNLYKNENIAFKRNQSMSFYGFFVFILIQILTPGYMFIFVFLVDFIISSQTQDYEQKNRLYKLGFEIYFYLLFLPLFLPLFHIISLFFFHLIFTRNLINYILSYLNLTIGIFSFSILTVVSIVIYYVSNLIKVNILIKKFETINYTLTFTIVYITLSFLIGILAKSFVITNYWLILANFK